MSDIGTQRKWFMAKGVRRAAPMPVQRGLHWAGARRGLLRVHDRGIRMGSWVIPADTVLEARIVWFRSFLGNAPVLTVRTADHELQFGLNPRRFWREPQLPFPVAVTDEVMGSVARVWLTRGLLAMMTLWLIGSWFVTFPTGSQ